MVVNGTHIVIKNHEKEYCSGNTLIHLLINKQELLCSQ